RPDGMALKPWWFRTTSHSCRCRRAHPNSTARKTSGSSCVRIGCQTGFSNPSTISSTTAATLGTHSSTNPGRLCPSRDATGQQSITQSEDWYKAYDRGDQTAPSGLHGRILASLGRPADDQGGNDGQGQRDNAAACEDCGQRQPDEIVQRSDPE